MGSSTSSNLTEEILEEYILLSYLNKSEIINLYNSFSTLDRNGSLKNLQFRFPCEVIEQLFPQLKFNPFKDRIFKIFSSLKDGKFSFEDMLDFCSVMSENCPDSVKATWAFKIFDFDEDDEIGENDILELINRLTKGVEIIKMEEGHNIIKVEIRQTLATPHVPLPLFQSVMSYSLDLLKMMNFTTSGTIGPLEFEHAIQKMSEFSHSFSLRL